MRIALFAASRNERAIPLSPRWPRAAAVLFAWIVLWAGVAGATAREVYLRAETNTVGVLGTIAVLLAGDGTENGVGFSLSFSAEALRFESVAAGLGAPGAMVFPNTNQAGSGTLGLAIALPPGQSFARGTNELIRIRILPLMLTNTALTFVNSPIPKQVADGEANQLAASFSDGMVVTAHLGPGLLRGHVAYYGSTSGQAPVSGVTMQLTGDALSSVSTAGTGAYEFPVNAGGNYELAPSKQVDSPVANGVTTLDISLIRRHILGLAPLDSPYKLLAADVNGSGSVTTLDISLIRRLVLGLTNSCPVGLWRFVPAGHAFADPGNPWAAPSVCRYPNLSPLRTNENFVAIKLGDVNYSWTPPLGALTAEQNNN